MQITFYPSQSPFLTFPFLLNENPLVRNKHLKQI